MGREAGKIMWQAFLSQVKGWISVLSPPCSWNIIAAFGWLGRGGGGSRGPAVTSKAASEDLLVRWGGAAGKDVWTSC